jgi:putative ABC transport system permease protein
MMGTLWQDVRYALRRLLKSPLFAVVAIVALALGIGSTSVIFSLANAFLLRPLPYDNPDQLVALWEVNQQQGWERNPVSYPNFADWRAQTTAFQQMAAYDMLDYNLTGDDQPERLRGVRVSTNLFSMLGAKVVAGREFSAEEEQPGNHKVLILSHGLWQRRFGGTSDVIGRNLTLNGESYAVVGVMPQHFQFPMFVPTDLWTPLALNATQEPRGGRFLAVMGRLKPGATIESARSELNTVARRIEQEYPTMSTGWGVNVVSVHDQLVERGRPALLVLLGAVGFVLLIACVNVANLMLARATGRKKEIALRMTLGASRMRLIRQLLTESLLLALLGGGLGFLLALLGIRFMVARLPSEISSMRDVGLDPTVLAFTLGISVLTGIIFGLVPALQASKPDLNEALKETTQSVGGGLDRYHLRKILVVAEVAMSLVLLIGAGLMIRSFLRLQEVKPGFDAGNLLVVPIPLPESSYPDQQHRATVFQQIVQRVETLSGVQSVGASSIPPLSGRDRGSGFAVEGRAQVLRGERLFGFLREVTPNYFSTMRIPVVKGRAFTDADRLNTTWVAMINETVARRYFPNEDPVGKRVTFNPGPNAVWYTIVGVAGDIRHAGVAADPQPEFYGPYLQDPVPSMTLLIRTDVEPGSLFATVRNEIRAVNKDVPLSDIRTMEQSIADSIQRVRVTLLFISIFAIVALALSVVGIYAFMAYMVSQRTYELGIRMALGARQSQVLRLILGQGMKLVLIGIGIGLAAALGLSQVMSSLLFGIGAFDVPTFVAISLLLSAVALVASFFPALKATKVDPIIALRVE